MGVRDLKPREPVPAVTSIEKAVHIIHTYLSAYEETPLVELIGYCRFSPFHSIDKYVLVDALRYLGLDVEYTFLEFSPGKENVHFGEDYGFDNNNHIVTVWHYPHLKYAHYNRAIVTRHNGTTTMEGKEYKYELR